MKPISPFSAGTNPEGCFGHVRRCANSKKNMRERHVVLEHFTPTLCGKCTRFCSTFLTFTVTHAPKSSGLLSCCLHPIDIFLRTAWCNDELPWCLAHVLMLRSNTFTQWSTEYPTISDQVDDKAFYLLWRHYAPEYLNDQRTASANIHTSHTFLKSLSISPFPSLLHLFGE